MVKKVVRTTVTTIKESSKKKTHKKPKHKVKRVLLKRVVQKKITPQKEHSQDKRIIEGLEKRDKLLVENFVGLQKAMATLSIRFSELSQNISNLLIIFESAAKILAESEKQVDKTLTTKLDALVEQNKNLSREINMVESKMRRTSLKQNSQAPTLYTRQISTPQGTLSAQGAIPPKQLPNP